MKIPFTKNTIEVREYLKTKGFVGLSFFQDKNYVFAFLTTRANIQNTWVEKDYSTFDLVDINFMPYLDTEINLEDFKLYIEKILNPQKITDKEYRKLMKVINK